MLVCMLNFLKLQLFFINIVNTTRWACCLNHLYKFYFLSTHQYGFEELFIMLINNSNNPLAIIYVTEYSLAFGDITRPNPILESENTKSLK